MAAQDTIYACPRPNCGYEGVVLNDHYACPLCKHTLTTKKAKE
jgi:predicted RNA-binding Zn-ribbon protein involved in translation (DUF1610 family)